MVCEQGMKLGAPSKASSMLDSLAKVCPCLTFMHMRSCVYPPSPSSCSAHSSLPCVRTDGDAKQEDNIRPLAANPPPTAHKQGATNVSAAPVPMVSNQPVQLVIEEKVRGLTCARRRGEGRRSVRSKDRDG